MRVQSVQNKYNNSNYNKPDFGALEIRDAKCWNLEVLNEFVKNKQVQEFTTMMHHIGKDISAYYLHSYNAFSIPSVNFMTMDGLGHGRFFTFYTIPAKRIHKFQAKKAFAAYQSEMKKDIEWYYSYSQTMNNLDSFNKSMERSIKNSEINTTKKWWQIWK